MKPQVGSSPNNYHVSKTHGEMVPGAIVNKGTPVLQQNAFTSPNQHPYYPANGSHASKESFNSRTPQYASYQAPPTIQFNANIAPPQYMHFANPPSTHYWNQFQPPQHHGNLLTPQQSSQMNVDNQKQALDPSPVTDQIQQYYENMKRESRFKSPPPLPLPPSLSSAGNDARPLNSLSILPRSIESNTNPPQFNPSPSTDTSIKLRELFEPSHQITGSSFLHPLSYHISGISTASTVLPMVQLMPCPSPIITFPNVSSIVMAKSKSAACPDVSKEVVETLPSEIDKSGNVLDDTPSIDTQEPSISVNVETTLENPEDSKTLACSDQHDDFETQRPSSIESVMIPSTDYALLTQIPSQNVDSVVAIPDQAVKYNDTIIEPAKEEIQKTPTPSTHHRSFLRQQQIISVDTNDSLSNIDDYDAHAADLDHLIETESSEKPTENICTRDNELATLSVPTTAAPVILFNDIEAEKSEGGSDAILPKSHDIAQCESNSILEAALEEISNPVLVAHVSAQSETTVTHHIASELESPQTAATTISSRIDLVNDTPRELMIETEQKTVIEHVTPADCSQPVSQPVSVRKQVAKRKRQTMSLPVEGVLPRPKRVRTLPVRFDDFSLDE
jgi:hypothetical protein